MENKPLDWTSLSGFPSRTMPWSTWRWKEWSSTESWKILRSTLGCSGLTWTSREWTRVRQSRCSSPNFVSRSGSKVLKKQNKLFFLRHGDFRQRISQEEEDIQSILNWYNRSERSSLKKFCYFQIFSADGIFLNHLSQDIRGTNSSAVWRFFEFIFADSLFSCPIWQILPSDTSLPTKIFWER